MKVLIETRRGMLMWIAWSLLAGVGLLTVITAVVPAGWMLPVIIAVAFAALVWAWRQARWAARQLEALERDMTLYQMQVDDEDLR